MLINSLKTISEHFVFSVTNVLSSSNNFLNFSRQIKKIAAKQTSSPHTHKSNNDRTLITLINQSSICLREEAPVKTRRRLFI